jgi:hypothetical protein
MHKLCMQGMTCQHVWKYDPDDQRLSQGDSSSVHEESDKEDSVMAEPTCLPPACSESRQSSVDNRVIVEPPHERLSQSGASSVHEESGKEDCVIVEPPHERLSQGGASSLHEDSGKEDCVIVELPHSPPAHSVSRQSSVDNCVIVEPPHVPPALSKYKQFVMQDKGHECAICQINYRLCDATLGSFLIQKRMMMILQYVHMCFAMHTLVR